MQRRDSPTWTDVVELGDAVPEALLTESRLLAAKDDMVSCGCESGGLDRKQLCGFQLQLKSSMSVVGPSLLASR